MQLPLAPSKWLGFTGAPTAQGEGRCRPTIIYITATRARAGVSSSAYIHQTHTHTSRVPIMLLEGDNSLLIRVMIFLLLSSLLTAPPLYAAPTGPASDVLPESPASECGRRCGNVSIPYPFGFGDDKCHSSVFKSFNITCDMTLEPPKPFLGNYEIMSISLNNGELQVRSLIAYDCYNESGFEEGQFMQNTLSTLTFSHTRNKFVALGCDTEAFINGHTKMVGDFTAGCISYCGNLTHQIAEGSCSGVGCCTADVPRGLGRSKVGIRSFTNHQNCLKFNPCSYAFLVEDSQYSFHASDLTYFNKSYRPPVILDWFIGTQSCSEQLKSSKEYACVGMNSECFNNSNGMGYNCRCKDGYEGNPYLRDSDLDSCQDINECKLNTTICPSGTCTNIMGGYNCTCPPGTRSHGDPKTDHNACYSGDGLPKRWKLGLGIGAAFLLLLAAIFCLCCELQREKLAEQRRKVEDMKERLFQQNGGLFLREMLPPSAAFEIFTEDQLIIATNNFDDSQIAGRGGHGTVYRGRLPDGAEVAIKRSRMVDERQSKEFAREIGILSQINHVNIIKLLGCCLEVEIPMLVYEYVKRGTLHDFIHRPNHKDGLFSLATRMRIATEAAEALAYLHSYTSRPILHGDVKTSNILLDENYRAKVSDFGASTVMAPVNELQVATVVQGTCGYLDPEFLQTYQLTTKSDVYSFGVVLAELLTGKKPLQLQGSDDERGLAVTFVSTFKEDKLMQILDAQLVECGEQEVLWEISQLACKCLSERGDDRPTMKEVSMALHALKGRSQTEHHPYRVSKNPYALEESEVDETEILLGASVELSTYERTRSHSNTSSTYLISLPNRTDIEAGR